MKPKNGAVLLEGCLGPFLAVSREDKRNQVESKRQAQETKTEWRFRSIEKNLGMASKSENGSMPDVMHISSRRSKLESYVRF